MDFTIHITGFVAIYIFMLAAFAGWVIIGGVPAILHTPLMSGSNFVHGIVVVGGMYALLNASSVQQQVIGFFAVLLGVGNAAGGFAVTRRMHAMFLDKRYRSETQTAEPRQAKPPSGGLRSFMTTLSIAQLIIGIADLAAAFLFMYGLKRMSSPVTAPSGIFLAGLGMLVAILASFLYVFDAEAASKPFMMINVGLCIAALAIGGGIAWLAGKRVPMTAMPQMVALYNGMGGGAAGAIAGVELFGGKASGTTALVVTLLGALIGAISLSGSLIAWAKLQGVINKPLRVIGQQYFNLLVLLITVTIGAYLVYVVKGGAEQVLTSSELIYLFFGFSLVYGVLMTLPIGGADMPVVISIYNAATGLAVGLEGFVLGNPALMIAGMVVGAAGTLLTLLMARAMNRSVQNVLFTNFGDAAKHKPSHINGSLKPIDAGDAGIFMRYAKSVIIIPGYGLAAAQAQQKLYEFVKLLQNAGVSVKFAIHPVAGRMPGQMDVLLAEAGVPYDLIFQLDDINEEFKTTDVSLVIGANDVANPAARTDKSSPIFGMPILDADLAKTVYVIKRGQGKGYAGIVNSLFYADNCNMVYGDASAVLAKMIEAVRGLGAKAA